MSKVFLYDGSDLHRLTMTLMILNTYATHHCTNGFVDKFLSLLQNFVLLKLNNLPKSHYEVRNLVQNLGLGYISIHARQNGCVVLK